MAAVGLAAADWAVAGGFEAAEASAAAAASAAEASAAAAAAAASAAAASAAAASAAAAAAASAAAASAAAGGGDFGGGFGGMPMPGMEGMLGGGGGGGGGGMPGGGPDMEQLEMVMERFLWQSYPQHLQNTLFHAEKLAPHRKKPLRARLDQSYAFKAAADELVERANYRDALVQYEMAYGCFKFCEKQDRKIVVRDDAKTFRELRHERGPGEVDGPTRLWAEVDELLCSCLTMIAACNINAKFGGTYENAEKAASEALEVRPGHAPALYRRSEAHRRQDNDGDAVADARSALRAATRRAAVAAAMAAARRSRRPDEVIRVRLERHLAHCEAQREVNSWWWAFVGATSDAAAVPLGAVRRRPWLGVLLVANAVAYVSAGWVGSAAEVAVGGDGAAPAADADAEADDPTLFETFSDWLTDGWPFGASDDDGWDD